MKLGMDAIRYAGMLDLGLGKNGGYFMHGWQVLIGDIFGVEQDS